MISQGFTSSEALTSGAFFKKFPYFGSQESGKNQIISVSVLAEKPAIRCNGKGNIVSFSEVLVIPFEAVNLSAVSVRIVKIFAGKYHLFFQMNNREESNSLKNLGRPV